MIRRARYHQAASPHNGTRRTTNHSTPTKQTTAGNVHPFFIGAGLGFKTLDFNGMDGGAPDGPRCEDKCQYRMKALANVPGNVLPKDLFL